MVPGTGNRVGAFEAEGSCPVPTEATELLRAASRADAAAAARFTPLVYDALRELAARYLGRCPPDSAANLQPTALVHEAFLRLVNPPGADFKSRTHFFAVAAAAMRQILVDEVRRRKRVKRGGDWQRITLTAALAGQTARTVDLEALDEALTRLAELDARAAQVVQMRFFGGMTEPQIGDTLGVSERTVRNDWAMARAWLRCELGGEASEARP